MTITNEQILASPMLVYEEGLRFFAGNGFLNATVRTLVEDLEKNEIDYVVIGALALNLHGYRRFTHDIDLLMLPEGLEKFQTELVGKRYIPAFAGARKAFRTAEQKVPIEIITTDEFPGDGKPKSVCFEHPSKRFVIIEGVKTADLAKLIELKLASGMTSPGRLKDLADVQELIVVKELGPEMAQELDELVRARYLALLEDVSAQRLQDLERKHPLDNK